MHNSILLACVLLFACVSCDKGWTRLTYDAENTVRTSNLAPALPVQLTSIKLDDQQSHSTLDNVDDSPVLMGNILIPTLTNVDAGGNKYVMYSNTSRYFVLVSSYDSFTREERWTRSFHMRTVAQDSVLGSMSLIFTQKSQTPMLAVNIASASVVQILSIDSGQTLYKFDLQATKSNKKLKNLGVVTWISDFVQDTYLNTYFGCDAALCLIRNNMTIVRSRLFPNR